MDNFTAIRRATGCLALSLALSWPMPEAAHIVDVAVGQEAAGHLISQVPERSGSQSQSHGRSPTWLSFGVICRDGGREALTISG